MIYLLALIGAVTVGVVLWTALSPKRLAGPAPRTIAPDDDPDFLRRLNERRDDE